MLKFDQTQFDAVVIEDTEKLAEIAADDFFVKNELYSEMPYEVRKLLATTALVEARKYGMNTVTSLLGFVQLMVEMTPRFSEMHPFDELLTRQNLSPDQKIDIAMGDESTVHWRKVLKHIDDNNDWHLDYWDEHVDWSRVEHLRPVNH